MADRPADAGFQDDCGLSQGQGRGDPRRVSRVHLGSCRRLELFSQAIVAIDGSKFKAVNRYLSQLDAADRQESQGARESTPCD